LKLKIEALLDPPSDLQQCIETFKAWLDALAAFGKAWLDMEDNGSETRLNVVLCESP